MKTDKNETDKYRPIAAKQGVNFLHPVWCRFSVFALPEPHRDVTK